MPQNVLPFQYEPETQSTGLLDSAGLPLYLELMAAIGLPEQIEESLADMRQDQGWTNVQQITSLVLMQLAGGEALEHLDWLDQDRGLSPVLEEVEHWGQYPSHQEALQKRWRIDKTRTVPSPDAAGDYLKAFDSGTEQARQEAEGAFVPEASAPLKALRQLVGKVATVGARCTSRSKATLDMDACLSESHKRTAKPTYEGFPGFQPLNIFWFEEGTGVASEYRDGNCPAGWNQLTVLTRALRQLPECVETVRWRADTAGYDTELLKYCTDPEAGAFSERFGRIEWATGVDVTEAFKQAVRRADTWHRYRALDGDGTSWETSQQWARVPFVPDWLGYTKRDLGVRFFAIREPIRQPDLLEDDQQELSLPTMEFNGRPSKITGVVTNRNRQDLTGEEVIRWWRGRCGWSEKVHSEIKYGLAGDKPPFSDAFQGNAAWWQINWLAYNLHVLMQRFGVKNELNLDRGESVDPAPTPNSDSASSPSAETTSTPPRTKRRKVPSSSESGSAQQESAPAAGTPRAPAIERIPTERYRWLRVSGRVIRHAGTLRIRIHPEHPALEIIRCARRRIAHLGECLARGPPNRWLPAA